MLNVQKYLKDNTLESLENELGIVVSKYGDRVVLNYSQISSPRFHPVCDECRALILSLPDYKVVSRSFDRFYNLGELDHIIKDVDITKMITLTKEDGSLINVYHWDEWWHASTRKQALGEGHSVYGTVFNDLFQNTLEVPLNTLMRPFNKEYTYIFEVCTPENRVVKRYPKPSVFLLAIRNKNTGEYLSYDRLESCAGAFNQRGANVNLPEKFTFKSFSDIKNAIENLPTLDEGYVLWNEKTGFRIKMKSPSYVAIHQIRNNGELSPKNISILIYKNEYKEYLSYYEEDKEFFVPYINAYNKMINEINTIYDKYKNIENQKEFALQVKDLPVAPVLFSMRKGQKLYDILDSFNDNRKLYLLEKYKEK